MNNDILKNINDKLTTLDKIISLQKKEISKSESSLLSFKNCLSKQKIMLYSFINERDKLKEERVDRFKLSNLNEQTFNEIYESVMKMGAQSNKKRKKNVDPLKFLRTECEEVAAKRLKSEIGTKDVLTQDDSKSKLTNNSEDIKSPLQQYFKSDHDLPVYHNDKIQIKRIQIPEIKNKTIFKIIIFGNDICIGGSEGMLLKYRHPRTQVFVTDTKDDILQIEVMKSKSIFCLVAFTNSKILIYDGMGNRRDIVLPGIRHVFNEINETIYIPTTQNAIKKLLSDDLILLDHICHRHGEVRCFIPGKGRNMRSLISLQDSFLYIVENKDFINIKVVKEVNNVERILRVRYNKSLCYSNEKIWFFNADFEIIETLGIKHGIKFVDVTFTTGAVMDGYNTLHLYNLLENGCFGEKMFEKTIDGIITAMSIVKKNVFMADGCDIVVIENIF